uniref:leucine-rich repeat transmembrane protein FLRT3-like n=1 Tax=Myxine glutinosa TaxID=7769 RepID=UPI00358F2AB1
PVRLGKHQIPVAGAEVERRLSGAPSTVPTEPAAAGRGFPWGAELRSLLLLLLLCLAVATGACPGVCRCNGGYVYCNDRGLSAIPPGVPAETTTLFLQNNQIPDSGLHGVLHGLLSLQVLYLYGNRLEEFPTNLPPNLRELHLQENGVESVSGKILARTPLLERLHLDDNSISSAGIDSSTFLGTPRIRLLFLSRNHLSAVPLGLPHGLEELRLEDNRITEIAERAFGHLGSLRRLVLDGNLLTDVATAPGAFLGLPSLVELSLSRNLLTTAPAQLPTVTLQRLLMQDNQITWVSHDALQGLRQLQRLDMSGNRLRTLQRGSFDGLDSLNQLFARNNPWHCDCNLLWLRNWMRARSSISSRGMTCQSPESVKGLPIRDLSLGRLDCSGTISVGDTSLSSIPFEGDKDIALTPPPIFSHGGEFSTHGKVSPRIQMSSLASFPPVKNDLELAVIPCTDRKNGVKLRWKGTIRPTSAHRVSWVKLGPSPPVTYEKHEATVIGTGNFLIGKLASRSIYRICVEPIEEENHEQGRIRVGRGACVDVNTTRLAMLGKSGWEHSGQPGATEPELRFLPLAGIVGGVVSAALLTMMMACLCCYIHHSSDASIEQPLCSRSGPQDRGNYSESGTKPDNSILEICETHFESLPLSNSGTSKGHYQIQTIFPTANRLMVFQTDASNSSSGSNRSYRDSGIPDSDYSHTISCIIDSVASGWLCNNQQGSAASLLHKVCDSECPLALKKA